MMLVRDHSPMTASFVETGVHQYDTRTKYFGVIGIRDYIKIEEDGKKRRVPFWELLDRQPDGWLTSLAYKRVDMPATGDQIWDCGAWSYKDEYLPKLGGTLVTPEWTIEQYAHYAKSGALVIAPDHLLIDGVDIDYRRKFNKASALAFLPRAREYGLRPMAAIHGMDLRERLEHAKWLLDIGYDALAVGGVAARASQFQAVVEMIEHLRDVTRGTWLHVLGLSAPAYMEKWYELGIDSCDGSSHFKQAFTGGTFYEQWGTRLVRHQAARIDETRKPIGDLPELCDCTACTFLASHKIDTRTYGSNENNMGRAAHNLNMLMRTHDALAAKATPVQTVCLISCVSQKLDHPAPARDLYVSQLFKKARAFAEGLDVPWHILSAEHGLLDPHTYTTPYDRTLSAVPTSERRTWAKTVADELLRRYQVPTRFIILAGRSYRDHLMPLLAAAGHSCEVPLEGLGIGQQGQWLKAHTNVQADLFQA